MNLLKKFGLGLLYFFMLPFFLIALACVAIYGIFVFLIKGCIGIFRFFKGESFFPELYEDKRVLEIKAYRESLQTGAQNPQSTPAPAPSETKIYVQQNYYQTTPPQNQNGQNIPNIPVNPGYVPYNNPSQPLGYNQNNHQINQDTQQKQPELIEIKEEDEQ